MSGVDGRDLTPPHARALPHVPGLPQLPEHRGTQFHPQVVEAFLAVAQTEPGELGPPGRERAVAAAS